MNHRSFTRSSTDKLVTGVCGGIARYLGVETSWVRGVMVLIALLVHPFGWLLYPALWLTMPTDAGAPSGLSQLRTWMRTQDQQNLR